MLPVLKFLVISCLTTLSFPTSVLAQAPDVVVNLGVSSGGMRRQVPGRWATLAVGGSNPTDQDREETMTVILDSDTNLQYARQMWLPAGSRRRAWLPIQIPMNISYDQNQIDFSSMQIYHSAAGEEQFQKDVVGMSSTRHSLLLSKEESRAAIVLDRVATGDNTAEERNRETANTVNAGRDIKIHSNLDEGLIHVQDHFLPTSLVGLDAIDQIVIASDRILNDTLSLSRLQSWLQSGGRVWLMADRVSPEAAQRLLGEAMCYSVVDRVELNSVEFSTIDPFLGGDEPALEEWSSERPVELVRVIAESDDVICTVDNWPAAFRKRVGRGSVLFTTVGARGWIRDGIPLQAYARIAIPFFEGREVSAKPVAELTSFVDDEIGYSIARRHVIALLLGLHLMVMIVAGVWLAKRKSLQYLAVVIPVVSLLAASALIAIGRQQTTAVPSTVAISQIIRNLPGSSVVNLQSVAAVYSQTEQPLDIASSPDSISLLGHRVAGGEIKRLQWDDSGRSKWLFVNQPPGVVRHVETQSVVELSPPWMVQGTFTKTGFQGRVQGLSADRSNDAVIVAAPAPALAVAFGPALDSTLTGDRDDVLSPGQFIDAAIVSDVQRARQELLRQMFTNEVSPFGRKPILLVWTNSIDAGAHFDDGFEHRGSALASVPIELTQPPSGTEFQVPATFVRIEPYAGIRGMTAIFNAKTGQWLEMSEPRETEIQCVMPTELLPCTVRRASVTIKISAPSRTLNVKCLVDGEFQSVYRKQNPSGLIRFDIRDPQFLTLNDHGGLVLSLDISQSDQERSRSQDEAAGVAEASDLSRSTWKIDYLHVDFAATMQ